MQAALAQPCSTEAGMLAQVLAEPCSPEAGTLTSAMKRNFAKYEHL